MRTTVTLARWGNSLAVRIPKDALEAIDLHEGDLLDIVSDRGNLVLTPQTPTPSLDELIAAITPENVHAAAFDTLAGAETW